MVNPQNNIQILHITDSHLFADRNSQLLGINTRATFNAVLDHAAASNLQPERILATGDISQDGNEPAYDYFLQQVNKWQIPVHALPGNHDLSSSLYTKLGAVSDPVIDCGAWRIIMLDTSIAGSPKGNLATDQLDLIADNCNTNQYILLAMHHNPIPMQSQWLDTMQIQNSRQLLELTAKLSNIKAMVWGHVHQAYDDWLELGKQRIRMLATPSTCFQFLPQSADFALDPIMPGYRWITLQPDGMIKTTLVRIPAMPDNAGQLISNSSGY